ncbi:MAG: hypothetical protein U9O98_08855 [Asgard group archaeon]|nr:hypothetical protein [Asgard group archaeon]
MKSKAFGNNQFLPKARSRIATLDFLRGLAIWLMTFLHAAANIYDSSVMTSNMDNFMNMPIGVIILAISLGFFGIWNSFFLLISAIVNSLSFSKRIQRGQEHEKALFKQLLTGVGLLIVNMIDNSFLYSGYFGTAFRTGDWSNTYPLYRGFFEMGTLRIIAWALIINSILLYFLLRKNGYQKTKRNILVFGCLAIVILIITPFFHNWVDNMAWTIPTNLPPLVDLGENPSWPNVDFQALNASFKSWILTIFAGDIEPFFPYLATGFIGAIIGLFLVNPQPPKKLPYIGCGIGAAIIGVGGAFVAMGMVSLDSTRPPLGNYFIMLGAQLITIFLFLWLIEFRGKGEKFATNPIVKHFRLWGIISLTIYTLQIYELLPRLIIGNITNWIFNTNYNMVAGSVFGVGGEYKAILFAFIVILFFELLIYLWSRINFLLSFEWSIISITNMFTDQKSYRLNVQIMLNNINWVNYSSIETIEKDKSTINATTDM